MEAKKEVDKVELAKGLFMIAVGLIVAAFFAPFAWLFLTIVL